MNEEQSVLNRILLQIKDIPPTRTMFLAGILCLIVVFSLWNRGLKPMTEHIGTLRPKAIRPEEFVFLELAKEKAAVELQQAKVRLKNKQQEVQDIAKARNISVNPNVYAEVVAAVNQLINDNYLKLIESHEDEEKKKGAPKPLSSSVAQFSQSYVVSGDFADLLGFLEDVNRLPYLCQITMTQLQTVDLRDLPALDKRILNMSFRLTLYYLQAKEE